MRYFLDTYALIDIANGNENAARYFKGDSVTLKMNLIELYYYFLREYNEKTAEYFLKKFMMIVEEFSIALIGKAMKIRYQHRKLHLSYIDCLGYAYAREEKRIFVTGDRAFAHFEGVEIVR